MGDLTLLKLDMQGATATINLPFSGRSLTRTATGGRDGSESETATDSESTNRSGDSSVDRTTTMKSSGGVKRKAIAVVGLLAFVTLLGAAIKYRGGDDDDGGKRVDLSSSDDGGSDVVTVSDEQ